MGIEERIRRYGVQPREIAIFYRTNDMSRLVEQELAALGEVQAGMQRAPEPEVFAPQVELGIRMNNVLRDWLREQIKASATEGGQRKGPHP